LGIRVVAPHGVGREQGHGHRLVGQIECMQPIMFPIAPHSHPVPSLLPVQAVAEMVAAADLGLAARASDFEPRVRYAEVRRSQPEATAGAVLPTRWELATTDEEI